MISNGGLAALRALGHGRGKRQRRGRWRRRLGRHGANGGAKPGVDFGRPAFFVLDSAGRAAREEHPFHEGGLVDAIVVGVARVLGKEVMFLDAHFVRSARGAAAADRRTPVSIRFSPGADEDVTKVALMLRGILHLAAARVARSLLRARTPVSGGGLGGDDDGGGGEGGGGGLGGGGEGGGGDGGVGGRRP